MPDTHLTKKEEQAVQRAQAPETETIYIPDVDISENNERIRLVVNMPGVDQKSVDVSLENNVLTIEGTPDTEAPDGYQLVGQEYGVGKYRRDFTLSDSIDTTGIKARVQHGVLEVTIPKREEVKAKTIKIES